MKLITHHIWEDYIEACEDIRHTDGMKALGKQKETIERDGKGAYGYEIHPYDRQ